MSDTFFETLALVMLFLAMTTAYYAFYLQPRNEVLYDIMGCMSEHESEMQGHYLAEEAYSGCVEKMRPSRASPPGM
tara:strand:- start:171 stop:398 length:228 start_codon:yes stop_codon:yes gene_type:complete